MTISQPPTAKMRAGAPATRFLTRAAFLKKLDAVVASNVRHDEIRFALLLINCGRLGMVNRTFGPRAGDDILQEIRTRLARSLAPGSYLSNLWGNKFAVLVRAQSAAEAMTIAQQLIAVNSVAHFLGGRHVFVPLTIGITLGPNGYQQGGTLIRDAYSALEQAKHHKGGSAAVFDPSAQRKTRHAFELENDLRAAVEEGSQFKIAYQPLMDLRGREPRLTGFEALARWWHPAYGAVPPSEFIPLAEVCGLISGLGEFVLWGACHQQVEWYKKTGEDLAISVNISPVQLDHGDLVERVMGVVHDTGINPRSLKLEVTETALGQDYAVIRRHLSELRANGISIGLDDFGAGFSSLGQLDTLPLDFLKIDRIFISRMEDGQRHQEMVKIIAALGDNLGLKVVAEGIENERQLAMLSKMGVHIGQGYYLGRPMAEAQATTLVSTSCEEAPGHRAP